MSYATINGQELHYETYGAPAAGRRPLVLLHGGLLTTELSFGPLLEPLAAAGRSSRSSCRGTGTRPTPTGRWRSSRSRAT